MDVRTHPLSLAAITLLIALLAFACGEPPEKEVVNASTNNASANSSSGTHNTANANTNGGTSSTTNGQPNSSTTCTDGDGDGFGAGCELGEDCDDTVATCTDDCSDAGGNGTADCAESVGAGVFLYYGSGGGGPDHRPEDPESVYRDASIPVSIGETVPENLADEFGVLVLLNPMNEMPPEVGERARALVSRGGRLVSVVDHSGYGGHEAAAPVLAAVGSTMRSIADLEAGYLELQLADVPELRDGVTTVSPYYSARIDVGDGIAFGQTADGYVAIGYEEVGRGDVLIVGDASMFGYALDTDDNAAFIRNFANLRGMD